MSYFIFNKNLNNIDGSIYKIASNQSDLNNLNLNLSDYKIIEESQENFNEVQLNNKSPIKYYNETITYTSFKTFFDKNGLQQYINILKNQIQNFLNNNTNHPLFNQWKNYLNQLNNFNLDTITYPLNKSLEEYFKDLNQPYFNILQLP